MNDRSTPAARSRAARCNAAYRRVVAWAYRRYQRPDQGDGVAIAYGHLPSRYTVIEDLAAARYLGVPRRRWAGFTLALAATEILPLAEQARRRTLAEANH